MQILDRVLSAISGLRAQINVCDVDRDFPRAEW
jgi:hypothetical protein